MFLELASAAYLIGREVYHRIADKPDTKKRDPEEVSIPRTDEGAPVPLFCGRCRVRQPILAWCGTPEVDTDPDAVGLYRMDLFFVVGIPFNDGAASSVGLHNIWVGDAKLEIDESPAFTPALVGSNALSAASGEFIGDRHEWYDGNAAQEHVDATGSAVTALGARLLAAGWSADEVPGFRGYVSVLLHTLVGQWWIGGQPSIAPYSVEASTYQTGDDYPATGIYGTIGPDSNPINWLWDVLKSRLGKLGLPITLLDKPSFSLAAITCFQEDLGYSRAIEDARDGADVIREVEEHVDGVVYEDPADGLIKIKLIRPDYSPADLDEINKDNCIDIVNHNLTSPSGVPNAIRVVYTDRDSDYNDNSEQAKNPANAVGQSNQVRWLVKQFPGCTTATQAKRMANRELAAECRIVEKCRALVDRSFRNKVPGDVVRVVWSKPDIANRVFRVAAVDRGKLGDATIALDLISDYFYVSGSQPPRPIPEPKTDLIDLLR